MQTQRSRRGSVQRLGKIILLIGVAVVLMLGHVTLRVRTGELAREVDQLKRQRQVLIEERQVLVQQVEKLSRFGRIHEYAKQELGLVFPPTEKIDGLED